MGSFRAWHSQAACIHRLRCSSQTLFNASGSSVNLISEGALVGSSGAGELNTKHVPDDLEISRTEFKPDIVSEESL